MPYFLAVELEKLVKAVSDHIDDFVIFKSS